MAPLLESVDCLNDYVYKHTKDAVTCPGLDSLGWIQSALDYFKDCRHALAHQVTLAYRNDEQSWSLYSDETDRAWSGIVARNRGADVHKPHVDQDHVPIAFLSDHCDATQLGWSDLEKEAYIAQTTLVRMHWLVTTTDNFDLCADNNNLIFHFKPLSVLPDLSGTSCRKVLPWVARLSMHNYTCCRIIMNENI